MEGTEASNTAAAADGKCPRTVIIFSFTPSARNSGARDSAVAAVTAVYSDGGVDLFAEGRVTTGCASTRVACVRRVWPPYLIRLTLPPARSPITTTRGNKREKYHRRCRRRRRFHRLHHTATDAIPPLQVRLLIPPAAALLGRWWRKAVCELCVATAALVHTSASPAPKGANDARRRWRPGTTSHPRWTNTHTRVRRPASFVLQTFSVLFERRPWMQGRRWTAVGVVLRSWRTNSEKTSIHFVNFHIICTNSRTYYIYKRV